MNTAPMPIKALAPWFGSKRTLAPRIIAELGPHRAYWEPFCGSMAVLLAKPPSSMETVNDLHGDLVNLARVVQDARAGSMLYRRLRRAWCAKALLDVAAARCRERGRGPAGPEPDVDRAFDYFLTSWLGRNGVSGTHSYNRGFCRRFTNSGGHAAKRFSSAVDSIPAWRVRMRNVTILSDDAFELLEKIGDERGCVIYVDPPYVEKGASYIHDFDSATHARLAGVLARFERTRVVVSYYEHPILRELYPQTRWNWLDCTMTKALVNQGQRDAGKAVKAPERLIVNGPLLTGEHCEREGGGAGLFG